MKTGFAFIKKSDDGEVIKHFVPGVDFTSDNLIEDFTFFLKGCGYSIELGDIQDVRDNEGSCDCGCNEEELELDDYEGESDETLTSRKTLASDDMEPVIHTGPRAGDIVDKYFDHSNNEFILLEEEGGGYAEVIVEANMIDTITMDGQLSKSMIADLIIEADDTFGTEIDAIIVGENNFEHLAIMSADDMRLRVAFEDGEFETQVVVLDTVRTITIKVSE
jgi:hypothetical protein